MRRRHLALLLLGPLFVACPYSSVVAPPHDRALPIDRALVGSWRGVTSEGGAPANVDILAFSDTDYLAEFTDGEGEVSRLRAFAVKVGGRALLAVQAVDDLDRDRDWMFFAYEIAGGDLIVRAVSGDVVKEKAKDGAALLALLEKTSGQPGFLEEPTKLGRQASAS